MICERCPLAEIIKPRCNKVKCMTSQEERDLCGRGQCEIGERIERWNIANIGIAKEQLFNKTLDIIEKLIK